MQHLVGSGTQYEREFAAGMAQFTSTEIDPRSLERMAEQDDHSARYFQHCIDRAVPAADVARLELYRDRFLAQRDVWLALALRQQLAGIQAAAGARSVAAAPHALPNASAKHELGPG